MIKNRCENGKGFRAMGAPLLHFCQRFKYVMCTRTEIWTKSPTVRQDLGSRPVAGTIHLIGAASETVIDILS